MGGSTPTRLGGLGEAVLGGLISYFGESPSIGLPMVAGGLTGTATGKWQPLAAGGGGGLLGGLGGMLGGSGMGGLGSLFGGGSSAPTAAGSTIGLPASQNYGVPPIDISGTGAGTVLAPQGATTSSGGGVGGILDTLGGGSGGGLGGTLKNLGLVQGLLGGGGKQPPMAPPPPIQRQTQGMQPLPFDTGMGPSPPQMPMGAGGMGSPVAQMLIARLMSGQGLG